MLKVSANSLVGKVYFYWVSMGGWKPYQENLCHFVRVCVFWAPWYWFWRQDLIFFVRPWMLVLAATYLYLIAKYPGHVGFWSVVLLTLIWAIVLVFAVLQALSMVWDKFYYARYRLSRRINRIFERTIVRFFKKIPVGRVLEWFFEARYRFGIRPWMVAFLAFQISSLYWAPVIFILAAVVELVILVLVAVALGYIYLEEKSAFATAGAAIGGATRPVTRPVVGTLGVAASWVMAMKRKICPYIELAY